MRNGNFQPRVLVDVLNIRSYPTYEEWKHPILILLDDGEFKVLILPMRNGNKAIQDKFQVQSLVLILPMRNGNFYPLFQSMKSFEFLSYL